MRPPVRNLCNQTVQVVRPNTYNQGLCPEIHFAVSSSPEASTASEGTATPHSDSSHPVDPVGGFQVETINNHYDAFCWRLWWCFNIKFTRCRRSLYSSIWLLSSRRLSRWVSIMMHSVDDYGEWWSFKIQFNRCRCFKIQFNRYRCFNIQFTRCRRSLYPSTRLLSSRRLLEERLMKDFSVLRYRHLY